MCQEATQRLNALKHETQAQNSSAKLKRRTQAQNSSIKLKHKTQAQNSSTNGGDASRVGKRRNKELNPTLSTDAGRVAPIRDRLPHRHNKKAHSEMLVRACGMRFLFCNFKSHATLGCDLKFMYQTFTPEAKTSLP